MERLAFDFEANGLVHNVTELWCIAIQDLTTGEKFLCSDYPFNNVTNPLEDGVKMIEQADVVYAHNGIGYDAPVLNKLYGIDISPKLKDTFVASQLCFPKLESAKENPNLKHGHSIEAWGERLGVPKVKNEDWGTFTQNILDRCIVDVDILVHIIDVIGAKFTENPELKEVFEFEQEVYRCYSHHCSEVNVNVGLLERAIKRLEALQEAIVAKISASIPMRYAKQPEKPHKALKKDGNLSTVTLNWAFANDINPGTILGEFTKLEYPNVNSTKQVVDWLLDNGWKPDTETASGSPSLAGSSFNGVPKHLHSLLNNNNVLKHRLGLLRGIYNKTEDGILRPYAHTAGTNTRRFEHKILVNLPRVGSKMGFPARAAIIPRPGHVLIGADASGLEARVEAHYTYPFDNGAYASEIMNGDIHQKNADALGISRQDAKPVKYGLTYGCGVAKLGTMLNVSHQEAQIAYDSFWAENDSLKQLKETLEKSVKKRAGHKKGRYSIRKGHDYIKTVDGSHIMVRGISSLINSLFQSAGSIIMKKAFIELDKKLKALDKDIRIIVFMHDEFQISAPLELADQVGELAVHSIKEAGEFYQLNVPLDGEYKIGRSWAETH